MSRTSNIGVPYLVRRSSLAVVRRAYHGGLGGFEQQVFAARGHARCGSDRELRNPRRVSHYDVVILVGSLSMQGHPSTLRRGHPELVSFCKPFTFMRFFCYFTCSLARSTEPRFDIPRRIRAGRGVSPYRVLGPPIRPSSFWPSTRTCSVVGCRVASDALPRRWTQVLRRSGFPRQLDPRARFFSRSRPCPLFSCRCGCVWSLPRSGWINSCTFAGGDASRVVTSGPGRGALAVFLTESRNQRPTAAE